MALEFEWDEVKAAANRGAHHVSFDEATTAFADQESVTIPDPDHSHDEERFILQGRSHLGRVLVVVHTERGDRIRIISARKATAIEKAKYAQG
ncbi:MAG: BrnT family toxin [Planctomycetota bacterium]